MSGDEPKTPPPGEDRTIFSPGAASSQPPSPAGASGGAAPEPGPDKPGADDSGLGWGNAPADRPGSDPGGFASPEPAAPTWAPPPSPPAAEMGRIKIGDVLNHIFEVRRFIARGGMGEVFEGVNVNSEERVAIKVILPHLAADPAVQAMFRKEARTLTRLGHPALVQYRVLAQEPQLGVFYIVTEFVEGQNLADILKELKPSAADLAMLTKRLAEGLAAAHALGAIHRDISPDNVLVEQGRLDRAKIIDFGIAKDLDASTGTIVGDGFAGKLNYVAPEQLGDFDRTVGPWTDVYSLGLLILAVAMGRDVNMGGSLVDAVDKRRAGPDLSPIPDQLRPVLEKMLKPNPNERARSMEEVLQLLVAPLAAPAAPGQAQSDKPKPAKPPKEAGPSGEGGGLASKRNLMIGGGAIALAVGGLAIWSLSGGETPAPEPSSPAAVETALVSDPAAQARKAITAALPTVPCAWLSLVDVEVQGKVVASAFRGVAGKPAEAQSQIGKILTASGLEPGTISFSEVSPINPGECGPIEAFRTVRDPDVSRLSVPQVTFEMVKLGPDAGPDAGQLGAQAVIEVDLNGLSGDTALVGIEESGEMTQFVSTKTEISASSGIQQVRPGVYRIPLNTTHRGWSGILMLTGQGPFDPALLSGKAGSRGADWTAKFLNEAKAKGWKADMVWYRTVDEQPNG